MAHTTLTALEDAGAFIRRHIGPREADIADMLKTVGFDSLDALTAAAVPKSILETQTPDIGAPMREEVALAELKKMAARNKPFRSLIGMGYYGTLTPGVILRNVLENPGWYTAYTPYQPEISQGRLEALLNYQHMVMDLTGLDLANASLLDEATAAAEAMTLLKRVGTSDSMTFLIADDCHPQTIDVVQTRAEPLGITVKIGRIDDLIAQNDAFGILIQYPSTTGEVRDIAPVIKAAHDKGMLAAVASDLLALTVLKPPGEMGADCVVGSSQRFGVPMGFGGPHAGFFAARDAYKRHVPGRIVGVSVDAKGRSALRLALQTREQHIRREKATSNICTAQVLLANIASFYAVYHGPAGLKRIGQRVHRLAALFAQALKGAGFTLKHDHFFDTVSVDCGKAAGGILSRAVSDGINLRKCHDGCISVAFDEQSTRDELARLMRIFAIEKQAIDMDGTCADAFPAALSRTSDFLTHPNFNSHHSETDMLRYLRKLESKDIALNRAMIPLGSCTMKLNATSEMLPVTWPELSDIHPFAPQDQVQGSLAMIHDLEEKLCILTGFHAASLQPNSGAQGEYAGLLAIRNYHAAQGHDKRNICLIPSSAHGTNPASAIMAGMDVVIVECDARGNIDMDDLKAKAEAHKDTLAALMVTYPSTHGVFEETIIDICRIVHDHGGQVYMDGANFNAMVGLALPGKIGADVMHLNLHKTFCIPHGGGGPGVGPICVAKHLAPHLPGHCVVDSMKPKYEGAVAAAPFGSASILPISWMYITMMGSEGLKRATQVAILNANYIARKLKGDFETLYAGANGLCAHECILDTRAFKHTVDIGVEDIAKRLMDFGFHAPTMSWPVVGTLMVEPTESEPKAELDRFITAMKHIRAEIRAIENGAIDKVNNPLKNAPHTMDDVMTDVWNRPYSKSDAAFPTEHERADKYWPPVGRVDNAHGDRNLVCACPSPDAYRTAEKAA